MYVWCMTVCKMHKEKEDKLDSLVVLNLAHVFALIELNIGSVLLVINIYIL